jgi:hypothetical protein
MKTEASARYTRLEENLTEQARLLNKHIKKHLDEKIEVSLKDQPVS